MNEKVDGLYRAAAWTMGGCGVWLLGLGLYFAFGRPSLLDEDLRFMATTQQAIETAVPGLEGCTCIDRDEKPLYAHPLLKK